ncbi:FdrA family protein [Planomonospora corallina]|uniref:FdrA family protein n=1 Tax=Planomonospora corallina TaxID=1806052 RepID=A0ABV8IH28_9ACTN
MDAEQPGTDLVQVRTGVYHDSVSLMRVSRAAGDLPGVKVAVVAMATELNLGIAAELGFELPAAGPGDLLVALRADDRDAAGRAAAEVGRLLDGLGPEGGAGDGGAENGAGEPPRTVRAAVRAAGGGATLALVSVPGPHAFAEALDAVEAGLSVMVFSDNVPVAQEVLLKRRAAERGVLVMGPDCGTAVVAGAGLGFANVLRPGPVGVVAASGTGAQQLTCLLDLAGVGVSHVLGVGGRDLSAEVGGLSTLHALAALDADPATELIVLVSKPPAPEVARDVRRAAARLATPVVTVFPGAAENGGSAEDGGSTEGSAEDGDSSWNGGPDLTSAAEAVLRALGAQVPDWPAWPAAGAGRTPGPAAPDGAGRDAAGGTAECVPAGSAAGGAGAAGTAGGRARALHGIYSGGTLCAEAELAAGTGTFTDYGDDAYTRGRAHPMIDPSLRLEALAAVPAGDVALLDVVLGHGADPDPAARLAPAIAAAVARGTTVVAALVGSAGDPQGLDAQAEALRAAGADVFASNARAARHAARLCGGAR